MSATTFIIIAVCLCLFLGTISVIVKKGGEYDLRIFRSKQFALLFFGALTSCYAVSEIKPDQSGLYVAGGVLLLSFAFAAILNIKKSNLFFGVVFTVFQAALVPVGLFAVLGLLGGKEFIKPKRPKIY